jgi:hypothetical protein
MTAPSRKAGAYSAKSQNIGKAKPYKIMVDAFLPNCQP